MTKIDYEIQVYCSHCGDPHYRTDCKLIPNWGYKCPECGGKCRVKPKYTWKNYIKKHPFVASGRKGRSEIHREIKEIGYKLEQEFIEKERSRLV